VVYINYTPAHAPSLVAYQRIIASTSLQHFLDSWMNYDTRFRTMVASDPTLRWDDQHGDLYITRMLCFSSNKKMACPHCGATNHYPDCCPFSSCSPELVWEYFCLQSLATTLTNHHLYRSVMNSTSKLATDQDAGLPTTASDVVPIIRYRIVHTHNSNPLHKPYPWTPVWSFLLECDPSIYPPWQSFR